MSDMNDPLASTSTLSLASLLLQPTVSSSPASYLSGSKDLISIFSLNPLYNTYVLPYLTPSVLASINSNAGGGDKVSQGSGLKRNDKGKGKEEGPRDTSLPPAVVVSSGHGTAVSFEMVANGSIAGGEIIGGAGMTRKIGFSMGGVKLGGDTVVVDGTSDQDAKKKKKVKFDRTYEGLINDVAGESSQTTCRRSCDGLTHQEYIFSGGKKCSGRNTIKKDSHLLYLVMNPDFPPVRITPFDEEMLRDGFTLRVGGIPDVRVIHSEYITHHLMS